MIDLNDLRVFESVASRRSFSAAARALAMPNSSVSRSVKRLENAVGTRLIQRTTREVGLTGAGNSLLARCTAILAHVDEAIDVVGTLGTQPRGLLRISVPIGIGYSLLPGLLPEFLRLHPEVDVALELTSRVVDLVGEGVDVAIRMGVLPDSRLVAKRIGRIQRILCAAPAYLERQGVPATLASLQDHSTIEMLGTDGRPRNWVFGNDDTDVATIEIQPRLSVNDPGMIHKFVANGIGIACIPAPLCEADLQAGRLICLFPEWKMPLVDMNLVFPSNRELSPVVRAFVDLMVMRVDYGGLRHVEPAQA